MQLPDFKKAKKRTSQEVNVYNYKKNLKRLGQNKKYYLRTYGCQMNEHDSEKLSALLEEMGFLPTNIMEEANLILLNTCAIRENVHNKVYGLLGHIKHLKQRKPNLITIITGCMTQEEIVAQELIKNYKWVNVIIGTHNIHNLPNLLDLNLKTNQQQIEVLSIEGDIYENVPSKRESKIKAWINVIYGCNKFCTYCIVPYTRGKERSRCPKCIIEEAKQLVKEGYKEITLLGQNVNAYGKDLDNNYYLSNLLLDVAQTKIERLRFITSHPWDFSDELIAVIKNNENIMPYIHLPIQSGSNKILKLMGRRYTKEQYMELYHKIKKEIPQATITTDIIVGFPNETEEDFQETIKVVNHCQFAQAYTFIYSKRDGTPAALIEDNISLETKKKRLQALNELINYYANKDNEKYQNKEVSVLLEGIHEKDNNILYGYTETMKRVNVKCERLKLGQIVKVKIVETKSWSLKGEIVK